ncbi:MAG TPA: C40 family peptidase [Selenomonadales bacterium]|nr:C40 family peptidase [Selenomonadales bacterium]
MKKALCVLLPVLVLASWLSTAQAAGTSSSRDRGAAPAKVASKQAKPAKKGGQEDKLVSAARKLQGAPYRYGGETPKGFDCSGLVQYVFKQQGKALPRTADQQFRTGKKVDKKKLRPGDVVFFSTTEKGASHCGIYSGDGKFIHASSSRGVMESRLADGYWKPRYLGARRML